jgi:predicted metal-binding protein
MHKFIEEIKIMKLEKLFFVENPIKLCRLPYPGHKKGCPNIGKNKDCPPYAQRLSEIYNLFSQDKYFCYVKFNLKKQKEKMKLKHPNWSDRQCKCLLYWQKSVVKELRKKCNEFTIFLYPDNGIFDYELIPEAMGLHVFETMEYHGIKLERNPENYVYKIAFIGVLK